MKAGILAVGSELLGTDRVDTNSLRLTEAFLRSGATLVRKEVVGDDEGLIAESLRGLMRDCDLVCVTGGLGPTRDDLTREAVAVAAGRPLVRSAALEQELEERFARMGRPLAEPNRKQADLHEGAVALHNARGTAPGVRLDDPAATVFLFPGVPHELQGLIESDLEPWLAERSSAEGVMRQVEVQVAALPESVVEERIAPIYARYGQANVSILASPGQVRVRVRRMGAEAEADAELEQAAAEVRRCVGQSVFSTGPEQLLEGAVAAALLEAGATVSVAESCTGGLVGERLTAVSGSSGYFVGGVLAYSNEVKEAELGVARQLLERHGAVSQPVAEAMALGAQRRFGTTYALAVTGIAGPGGGSDEKPVGTVHLAVAGPAVVLHNHSRFPGQRDTVRRLSSQVVLEMLRSLLLGFELDDDMSGGRRTGGHA